MDINIAIVGGSATLLIFGAFLWLLFHKRVHRLRVLLYHKVAPNPADTLTVAPEQLHKQLSALLQDGYTFVSADRTLPPSMPLARQAKTVLLTFDDAYADLLIYALPILRELSLPAVFFVPTAYIGGRNDWDGATELLMTAAELQQLNHEGFALAYHSHRHQNYKHLSAEAIATDLADSIETGNQLGLTLLPTFAYPYGGRPKHRLARQAMYQIMQEYGIQSAFRIGNRINSWPIANPYEINRIDVRGSESLKTFLRRVRWGKWL